MSILEIPKRPSVQLLGMKMSTSLFTEGQLEKLEQLSDQIPSFGGINNHIMLHKHFWEGFVDSKHPFEYLQRNSSTSGMYVEVYRGYKY